MFYFRNIVISILLFMDTKVTSLDVRFRTETGPFHSANKLNYRMYLAAKVEIPKFFSFEYVGLKTILTLVDELTVGIE